MDVMLVTLDVSMLSGWLKAVASCVEIRKQGIRTVRGELCGRPRGARTVCREEGATVQRYGGAGGARERSTHVKHAVHVRDAGRVNAERLVERRGCKHVVHGLHARRVKAQRLVERRRAGEHELHVRDAGGVPAQRLVEGVRGLPRVASRAHGAGRAARAARLVRSGQGRGLRLQRSGANRAGSNARETCGTCS